MKRAGSGALTPVAGPNPRHGASHVSGFFQVTRIFGARRARRHHRYYGVADMIARCLAVAIGAIMVTVGPGSAEPVATKAMLDRIDRVLSIIVSRATASPAQHQENLAFTRQTKAMLDRLMPADCRRAVEGTEFCRHSAKTDATLCRELARQVCKR
jgi:hypothetical protein